MCTKNVKKTQFLWIIVLLVISSLFAVTQLTTEATDDCGRGYIEMVNETDGMVDIFVLRSDGSEGYVGDLSVGESWSAYGRVGLEIVFRDSDGIFLKDHTIVCGHQTVVITPPTDVTPPDVPEECPVCVEGVTEMTIQLVYRSSYGDSDERIRARVGGLDGQVLFDTNDSNPNGHEGLYEGESFTINVNPGDVIVITVQGDSHPHEYVKATFVADCSVEGMKSGNSYIKFKVIAVENDNDSGELCEDPPVDQLVSLGSTVFFDGDDNGEQGDGISIVEPGIPNVLVELLDPAGLPVINANGTAISVTTDSNGNYLFTDLLPGDYRVQITPPDNFPLSSTDTGSTADPNNDVDGDDNGIQGASGEVVISNVITLVADAEPEGADESAQAGELDDADDANGNMTLDFGLRP